MANADDEKIEFTVTREDLARLIAEAEGYDPDEMVPPLQMPDDPPGGRPLVPAWQKHGLQLADAIFDVLLQKAF